MNGYRNQPTIQAFTDKALTSSYADSAFEFIVAGAEKVSLDISYAMGASESANTLKFKLEHSSDDGVTWHSLVIDSTGATSVLTPRVWDIVGTNALNVLINIGYLKMRLSMIETGVATNAGTVSVAITPSGI